MEKIGDIEILDDNGWNLHDTIPEYDWQAEEVDMKITPDFGMGVRTRYKNEEFTFKRNPRIKPTVTLIITTWKGISGDAIHFYGKLEINLPEMEKDNRPGYTVGISGLGGIPMYYSSTIKLTQILEQWEKDKYPHNYEYYRVGQKHTGFYTPEAVERRAKEVFEKIFSEGWLFKVEKRY